MSWNDNPKTNNIDKVFVSETEAWEVAHFVDHYLKTNDYGLTPGNRETVKQAIGRYSGRAPVKRTDLTAFLNQQFKK